MGAIRNKSLNFWKLIVIVLVYLNLPAFSQEVGLPFVRNYLPKEYNNVPQIFAITSDSQGIVYFGAFDAVIEYDGMKWNSISTPNKSIVYSLDVDANDRVYVGSYNEFGYIQANRTGKKEFISLTHLVQKNDSNFGSIRLMKVFGDKVYFVTYNAVFEYKALPSSKIITYYPQKGNQWYGLLTHNGNVYVNESNRGLVCLKNGKTELVNDFYKDKSFGKTCNISKDTVLIPMQQNGVFLLNSVVDQPLLMPVQQSDYLQNNILYSCAPLPNQNMAIGSIEKGLIVISKEGNTRQIFNEKTLLQNNAILHVHNSQNNNLWMGLDNGISKSDVIPVWSYWDKNAGLKGVIVDIVRFENNIYVASTNGLFCIENNQPVEIQGIPAGACLVLLKHKHINNRTSLLAGTENGLYEIVGNKAKAIYTDKEVLKLYAPPSNPQWLLACREQDCSSFYFSNGSWNYKGIMQGVQGDISSIEEDDNRDIWIGVYFIGVYKVSPDYNNITKPKKVILYNMKDGLPSDDEIYPFRLDDKIVFGTQKGIYIQNPQTNRFEPYCALGKRFCNCEQDIRVIQKTKQGRIWISPSENKRADIGYLKPNDKAGYDWIYKPFRRIPQTLITCIYPEENGVVWIGGGEGLFRYDEKQDIKNYDAEFNTLIRKVTIGHDSVVYYGGTANSIQLNYKYNTVKFEFAAPFFDDESKTLYSYQLVGFEDNWSDWSNEGNAVYTNLYEGNYNFMVKAKNLYDKESVVATFQITILPPLHRTWWAYSIYAIVVALLIYGIVKWNTRRLRKEKEHLEGVIKQRTKEITERNIALERQKNEIAEKNAELEAQKAEIETQTEELQTQADILKSTNDKLVELDRFKEGMTGMIVHDLKNPLYVLINGSSEPETTLAGKQMLNMVLNILDVQKFESAQMRIQPVNFSLNNCLTEALQQVKLLYFRKSITVVNNLSVNLTIKGDYELINRVFINLLTNAIKFTPNNGKITIHENLPDDGFGDFIKISISDTGKGIPEDKLNTIFSKFAQAEAVSSGGIRSTGLGLAFCKLAIEAHNGQIGVDSVLGKGSSFWFLLPKGDSSVTVIELGEQLNEVVGQQGFALSVDDHKYLSLFIKELKEFTVYEYSDIDEILQRIDSINLNVETWKSEVKNALKTCNVDKYNELLNL